MPHEVLVEDDEPSEPAVGDYLVAAESEFESLAHSKVYIK